MSSDMLVWPIQQPTVGGNEKDTFVVCWLDEWGMSLFWISLSVLSDIFGDWRLGCLRLLSG